jgi:riboflavin biosynthesis pyrimidine reductase
MDPPAAGRARANMVVSLDGRAATQGRSAGLSSAGDKDVFAVLRSLADVVVVGAGTARTEGYRPATVRQPLQARRERLGQRHVPRIAVVSRSLSFADDDPLIDDEGTLVITSSTADRDRLEALRDRVDLVVAGDGEVDLSAALAQLADRGMSQVLCEGGPALLGAMAGAGLVDDLCLTIAPLVVGGDGPGLLELTGSVSASPFTLRHVLEQEGFLMTRYLMRSGAAS